MGWLSVFDRHTGVVRLGDGGPPEAGRGSELLMTRGSIAIEFQLRDCTRPVPLFSFQQAGDWPISFSLQSVPDGGVVVVLDHYGAMSHHVFNVSQTGRTTVLRLVLAWDSLAADGRVSIEHLDNGAVSLATIANPKPWRIGDVLALTAPAARNLIAPEISLIAVSDEMEPIGPVPGLASTTLVETADGPRLISQVQRGDLVRNTAGDWVPVLDRLDRDMPNFGAYAAVTLRAPYLGLARNITCAARQNLLLTGAETLYLVGTSSAFVSAQDLPQSHFLARSSEQPVLCRYSQLLLPEGEPFAVAGIVVASLNFAQLRNEPAHLAASVAAGGRKQRVSQHKTTSFPMLGRFDALSLTESRVA